MQSELATAERSTTLTVNGKGSRSYVRMTLLQWEQEHLSERYGLRCLHQEDRCKITRAKEFEWLGRHKQDFFTHWK